MAGMPRSWVLISETMRRNPVITTVASLYKTRVVDKKADEPTEQKTDQ